MTARASGLGQARPIDGARAGAAHPRRPLFLGPALRGRVDKDGPALRLHTKSRAETRFPLDRVSRIVAGARVTWSAEALRACLENAIPIVIVDEDGVPLGSVQPALVQTSPLAGALEEMLEWPRWREIYGCWLRAARMRVLTEWRRTRQAEGAAPDPRAYQDLVRRHVYGASTSPAMTEMAAHWHGPLYALAAATAVRWHIPPLMWGSGGAALDLRRDLAGLLELRLRLEVCQDGAVKDQATMLLVLNALTAKLEVDASRAMHALARRVHQVLTEWR